MDNFLTDYKDHIIWIAGVIVMVIVLRIVTNLVQKWLIKKEQEEFPGENTPIIYLIRRILNTLWIILGLIAISFVFVNREKDAVLIRHFQLVFYLGILGVVTIVAATSTNLWFKRQVREKLQKNDDPTSYKFLRYVAVAIIYFTGILFALLAFPSLRGVAQTALGGAGILALIAGVASQEALANVVGGVFIIAFKPFKIGDVVRVNDTMVGTVTDITLRHCVIRNFENKMIVIPNSIINKEKLINYDLGELKCCEFVEMGISYDSDVKMAKLIMREECEKHPLIYDNRTEVQIKDGNPIVRTALTKINDSTLNIRAWAWSRSFGDSFQLQCDVNESIKERFDAVGIDLAYPSRNIYIKGDENTTA
ncbi:mechanosensitive ion channel family protein [Nonlabens antarcticus]|uniref:mechanosensitive ion channel family protein n=1 Tax=Nonlabens antarcticus TaxID=392714 RepID=UPI00189196EA|nr:mechanosensitive ion channel family protein [Nonlabens antarcticus]